MTVCVVAKCEGGVIFGASDRMITAGDIQFEPLQTKLYPVSNSVVVQIAGDASIQAQIVQGVIEVVGRRIVESPAEWMNVRDMAELYSRHYQELRLANAEREILAPLGLDRNTWLARQKEMDSGLVTKIAAELMNYVWERTEAIFSGVDSTGAHIYVVRDGAVSCQDSVGFCAIGAGEWHADSQLMFDGHSQYKPVPETLLLVYSAKKRAEVAPGVGKGTDMFAIGPVLGSYMSISGEIIDGLEKIYQAEQKRHKAAAVKAKGEATHYVEEFNRRVFEEAQATGPSGPSGPSDTGGGTSPNA